MNTDAIEPISDTPSRKPNNIVRWLVFLGIGGLLTCCALAAVCIWYAGCVMFWAGNSSGTSPNPDCTYLNQGVTAMNAGDYGSAAKNFDLAIAEDPENGNAYALRADLNQRMGNLEGAITDYTRAIALNPKDATSYSSRAYVRARLGKELDEAFADVNFALTLAPDRGDYIDTRGFVEYTRGEYEAAVRDGLAALTHGELFAHYTLGLTYQAQGQNKQAIEQFQLFTQRIDPAYESIQGNDARERILILGGTLP